MVGATAGHLAVGARHLHGTRHAMARCRACHSGSRDAREVCAGGRLVGVWAAIRHPGCSMRGTGGEPVSRLRPAFAMRQNFASAVRLLFRPFAPKSPPRPSAPAWSSPWALRTHIRNLRTLATSTFRSGFFKLHGGNGATPFLLSIGFGPPLSIIFRQSLPGADTASAHLRRLA